MSDVADFIEARLAELEQPAREAIEIETKYGDPERFDTEWQWVRHNWFKSGQAASSLFYRGSPAPSDVMSFCAALRRVVAAAHEIGEECGDPRASEAYMRMILEPLAAAWRGHPAFQPEWARESNEGSTA